MDFFVSFTFRFAFFLNSFALGVFTPTTVSFLGGGVLFVGFRDFSLTVFLFVFVCFCLFL